MSQQLINRYDEMTAAEKATTVDHYLNRLSKSINVNYTTTSNHRYSVGYLIRIFKSGEGWKHPKEGYTWSSRVQYWDKPSTMWFRDFTLCRSRHPGSLDNIPVFPTWFKQALEHTEKSNIAKNPCKEIHMSGRLCGKTSKAEQDHLADAIGKYWVKNDETQTFKQKYPGVWDTKEESKMKEVFNDVLDTNKEALTIATKLSAGKTANSFFLNKIFGKFPWYAKLFGKKKEFTDNPLAKLATANMAKTLATHFAEDNDKLNYVADAMVQDAMVTLTRDSAMLENLIGELEGMIPELPNFDKGKKANA